MLCVTLTDNAFREALNKYSNEKRTLKKANVSTISFKKPQGMHALKRLAG